MSSLISDAFGKLCLTLCLAVLAFVSCSGKDKAGREEASGGVPVEEVEQIYRLYLDGNYKEYVAAIHSCDHRPEEYRRQMEAFCRAHAEESRRANGRPTGFSVARVLPSPDGQSSEVYLNVSYAGGEVEEVYWQFVCVDGVWRLR